VLKVGIFLALAVAALPHIASAQAGGGAVTGRWLTEDGKGVIAIAPCGNSICGRIDWMNPPTDAQPGYVPRDKHNPDPARRQQPICGLEIIYGFQHDGANPNSWVAGDIYDPNSGNIYHANIRALDPTHLQLRGYIGIPLLGESQVWTRADNYPRCRVG
jgi:uncharacterized protein (DUF2147 family)